MNLEQIRKRINSDPDFICLKRFDYSLKNLLDRYPDGVPNRIIAQALQMTEPEIEQLYEKVIIKLREKIK